MSSTIKGRNPLPIGDRWQSVVSHKGPASYTQVTPGTTPAGGDVLSATECGLKFIQLAHGGGDNTGTYFVMALAAVGDPTSVILRWFTAATMTEVAGGTNLSASEVELIVIGR
jgi:hypothetical protein